MADKNLSARTAATTPLTGAELLYAIQGGNTRKTTVEDVRGLAENLPFDNVASGLGATDVQGAIDEIVAGVVGAVGDMTAAVYDPNGVAGDAFDQDNMVDGTTNKNFTATEKTKLAGIEAAADVTDAGNVASSIHGVAGKTTPVNADELGLLDSAASFALKVLTWANVKATLKTYFDTLYASISGATLADGDYGDINVSGTGTVLTIDNDSVTYAKMQNVSGTDKLLGRSTAGSGDVEEIALTAAGRALVDDADASAQRTTLGLGTLATQSGTFSGTSSGTNTGDQTITLTGDVTGSGTGTFAATVANDAVTNAKAANMAQSTIKGRAVSAGTGDPTDLTAAQATAILDAVVGDSGSGGTKGVVPAPGAGDAAAGKFLKADGTFAVPAGTGVGTTASTTEVLTGTDSSKAVTPDALAALWEKGADVASSGTTSLGEGGYFHITGTTTITDIDWATAKDGRAAWVTFDGILTLTHHATTLKLPGGANITTAANDRACFVQDASDNVICLAYIKADGTAVVSSAGSSKPFISFSPNDNEPPSTNYATWDTRNQRPCLDFDTTTQETAIFSDVMPHGYAGGNLIVDVTAALTSATSGTLGWDVTFERVGSGSQDTDSDGFATAQTITATTVPGNSGDTITLSVTCTAGAAGTDSIAADDLFRLRIRRDVANDTAAGDAELYSVTVREA